MSTVLVVGGGFAGTSAAACLKGRGVNVILVDSKATFDFLPVLPDVLGRRFSPTHVSVSLAEWSQRHRVTFHHDRIEGIDLGQRVAWGNKDTYSFDDVIVATGAGTNFYGNNVAEARAHRLRSVDNVVAILRALEEPQVSRVIVVGAGYTGVETATHLRRYAEGVGADFAIEIAELSETVLPGQEDWIREYCRRQLTYLDIEVSLGTTVEHIGTDGVAELSNGSRYRKCLVIWNAGVVVSAPLGEVAVQRGRSGRVSVDTTLRATEHCYVVGDAAEVEYRRRVLPMAAYFADQQGRAAAKNILRKYAGKSQSDYRPFDFGLVVPLANGTACGRLCGVPVRGHPTSLVHHGAAWLRARSRQNRWARIWDLFRNGGGL